MVRTKSQSKKNEKFLEHGTVALNTINQKMSVHNTIYTWRLPTYGKLKRHIMYFQVFESIDVKCVFKLYKSNSTLYLCLRSGQLAGKRAQFYLVNELDHNSLTVPGVEVSPGLYVGEFRYDAFHKPELNYLRNDMLTVSFRYVSDYVTDYKEGSYEEKDVLTDLDELCCNLKHMYLESVYPDFEIHVQGYIFKAHKFILAARCGLFQRILESNPDLQMYKLEAIPGILHEVLLYVYSGELKDMDMACMLKVYGLAHELQVQHLVEKCRKYFEEHLDEENFDSFKAFVDETKATALQDILKVYLKKMKR